MHVWCTSREQYRPECLTPTVREAGGSVMLWGAFLLHSLGPFAPQKEGSLQINKVVLYSMMKHF